MLTDLLDRLLALLVDSRFEAWMLQLPGWVGQDANGLTAPAAGPIGLAGWMVWAN